MKKDLAESFSISFHPLLIPLYSILFLFVLPIFEVNILDTYFKILIISVILIICIIFPAISILILKNKNIISSLQINLRKERQTPYLLMFIFYFTATYTLYQARYIPTIIILIPAISAICCLIMFVANFFIKASAHAMGMACLNALILIFIYRYNINLWIPLGVTLFLTVIVILSRYYLKAHSKKEILLGFLLGLLISSIIGFLYI